MVAGTCDYLLIFLWTRNLRGDRNLGRTLTLKACIPSDPLPPEPPPRLSYIIAVIKTHDQSD